MSYTKLFDSLVHSTIWREPDHVRLVWVTMLALVNQDGVVEASLPGLADASRVTLEKCEDALVRFQSPDPYSRSKNDEGRRIREVDGGWFLLNHQKYRELMSKEDMREKARLRQQTKRERDRETTSGVTPSVTPCHASSQEVTDVTTYSVSVSASASVSVDPEAPALDPTPKSLPPNFDRACALPIEARSRLALERLDLAQSAVVSRWPEVVEAASVLSVGLGASPTPRLSSFKDHGVEAILRIFEAGYTLEELRLIQPRMSGLPWLCGKKNLSAVTVPTVRELLDAAQTSAQAGPSQDDRKAADEAAERRKQANRERLRATNAESARKVEAARG